MVLLCTCFLLIIVYDTFDTLVGNVLVEQCFWKVWFWFLFWWFVFFSVDVCNILHVNSGTIEYCEINPKHNINWLLREKKNEDGRQSWCDLNVTGLAENSVISNFFEHVIIIASCLLFLTWVLFLIKKYWLLVLFVTCVFQTGLLLLWLI